MSEAIPLQTRATVEVAARVAVASSSNNSTKSQKTTECFASGAAGSLTRLLARDTFPSVNKSLNNNK